MTRLSGGKHRFETRVIAERIEIAVNSYPAQTIRLSLLDHARQKFKRAFTKASPGHGTGEVIVQIGIVWIEQHRTLGPFAGSLVLAQDEQRGDAETHRCAVIGLRCKDSFDPVERASRGAAGARSVAYRCVTLHCHAKGPKIGVVYLSGFFQISNRVIVSAGRYRTASGRSVSLV